MQRIVEPELLDSLPPDDPFAIGSRRDLRRINNLMRSHAIMAGALQACTNCHSPKHLVDLGAGDGHFLLDVARRLSPSRKGMRASLLDRVSLVTPSTLKEFEKLGWRTENVVSDVFDWAIQTPKNPAEVVAANLFLHHFSEAQLSQLFLAVSNSAPLFVALEPRRAAWPLFCSRWLWAVGCNPITRHDAVASVRAGFRGRELSALWPGSGEWILTEKPAGLFSHVFIAQRH